MKNFTNNFKQFTSRLSARWLIMVLMLLVGTSSAWADWYLAGSFNSWSTNNSNYKLSKNNEQEYFITGVQLSNGDEFKFVENNQNWKGWDEISNKNGGDLENANGNIKITKSGTYDFYYTPSTDYLYTSYIVCASCCDKIEIKHPWGGGNNWTYKTLLCDNNNYSIEAKYGDNGCNWKKNGGNESWVQKSDLKIEGNPSTGDNCIFSFNTSNNTITITKVVTCNEITDVSSFSLSETEYNYNGSSKKPTVSSTLKGIGDITTKYYNSEGNVVSEPTNAGIYTVKITVSQGTTYCALTTETVVGTYTINKINQSDISIANKETTFCGFPANNKVTLNIEGGDGDGEVVYKSEDEDIATISGNILTVKAEGTVTISAQKQAGTNHKVSNTATKQFTFYKAPDAPTVKSVTNLIKCGDNTSEGLITLKNYNQGYSYSISPNDEVGGDAQEGYQISIADNYTITVTRYVNETCSLSTPSASISVGLTDNTPAATVSIADVAPICAGGSATLTCNVTPTQGTVKSYTWTLPGGSTQVTNTKTLSTGVIAEAGTYNYSVVVTLENAGCTKDFPAGSKSVTVKEAPTAPDFGGNNSETVCQGTLVTLPTEGLKWYDAETGGNEVADTAIESTGTYWASAVQNGCESPTRTRYDVTVNTLPTINIGEDVTAVKFEDVVLTATGENIDKVEWTVNKGTITEDAIDPKKAVLTYDQTGDVIVTAKAKSAAGCESAEVSKKVTFGEEKCTTIISKNIQITFYHPSTYNEYDSQKGQWWGMGTMYYSTDNKSWETIDLGEATSGSKTVTIQNITSEKLYVYFESKWTYHLANKASTIDDKEELTRGNSYDIRITQHGNNNIKATSEATCTGSLSTPAPLSAPAVKMVSAEYDEVNDKIVAKGAVYKTGCGTTFWGFQYSTDGQKWGTAETDYIRPNSGNSLTKAGEFEYSFAIPNAGGGDIYYIRAYALNNYNGSYALSNAVYSATSLPVEIPSKTIESATIALVEPSTDTEVCPQSTVYLKVSYVGGDFKDYEAAENFPGTNLELVNHDKVNNYAIFSYIATTTGVANITISNENTSVTPETGVNIAVKEVSVVTPPTIYLEKNTICETQTTNVVVNSPIVGLSYSLKNGSVGDPVTYESGDLKFPVSVAGSYTVQVQETVCGTTAISAPVDLRVITSDVKITLTTDVNTITPWQPLTLTVKAPSGYDYDLQGLDGMVYTKKGDVYTIKIPRPEGEDWKTGNTSSPEGTATKTFTASIKAGEDTSCSTTTKEVTLVDTEEECLAVGN